MKLSSSFVCMVKRLSVAKMAPVKMKAVYTTHLQCEERERFAEGVVRWLLAPGAAVVAVLAVRGSEARAHVSAARA